MTRLLTSKYISVGVTYISWFSDFALYLEYYLLDKCHTWDISSMWPNEWPLTISRSLWPIFHASVILPFIFITISWRIVIPGLLYLCDKMIYIQIHLGQCDLYYMVEWFRHITWKLFHRLFHFDFLNDNKNSAEGVIAPAGAKVTGATIRMWLLNKFISFLAVLTWKTGLKKM